MTEREALLEETVRELDARCVQLTQRNLALLARVATLEKAVRNALATLLGALEPGARRELTVRVEGLVSPVSAFDGPG